jgi:hypothetical protein
MTWQEIFPQLLLALIAASPGIYAIWRGAAKDKADVAKAITEAAGELVDEYKQQIAKIERTVVKLENSIICHELNIDKQATKIILQAEEIGRQAQRIRILELERTEVLRGIKELNAQIRKLGQEPVWEPQVPQD